MRFINLSDFFYYTAISYPLVLGMSHKCTACPNKSFIAVNNRAIYNHLKGDEAFCRDVIGTYVMLLDETTRFLAIDFD